VFTFGSGFWVLGSGFLVRGSSPFHFIASVKTGAAMRARRTLKSNPEVEL